jgi:hypothetical protein
MENLFDKIVTAPMMDCFQRFIEFLPNLLSSLVIFILGFLLGWIIKSIIQKTLEILNTDRFCKRMGITQGLERGGIKTTPTRVLSQISYWFVVIVFLIISLYTLKIPAIEDLLEQFFLYLPNVFVSALLIIVGYILSNFAGRATLIASVNSGIKFSGLLSKTVKTIIFLLAFTMALEQLGIGRDTVIVTFTVIFGGIVFALSLAFGLGGRDVAKEYIEKKLKGEAKKEDDLKHL